MKANQQTQIRNITTDSYPKQPKSTKKSRINPHLFKIIRLVVITLISWLNPEMPLVIFLIRLLFIILD